MVLATDGRRSIAIFNYAENRIQQSFSKYTRLYATVGYNVGDGVRSFTVNGSLTENIGDIDENPGNTGIFGQWIFRLDREQFKFTRLSQSPAKRKQNIYNQIKGTKRYIANKHTY